MAIPLAGALMPFLAKAGSAKALPWVLRGAGALGGAAIIGLIPGIGDAAAAAIRTGARKALDVGKNVEINPNVMSAFGAGAIRKRTSLTLDDFGYREDNPIT